jgi:large repetitive protein
LAPRQYHDSDIITIRNDGNDVLNVTSLDLSGPFKFLDLTDLTPFTLAVGASRDIEIGFDSSPQIYDPETDARLFKGELKVISDDPDEPLAVADLAGFWQPVPEGNVEPDFNQLMEILGLGIRADLDIFDDFDIYEASSPDEILAPYFRIAPGFSTVTVTQVAAYHDINTAPFGIFAPGNANREEAINLLTHSNEWNQSVLPLRTNGLAPTITFNNDTIPDSWTGDEIFGIRVAGQLSDPRLNNDGPGQGPPGEQRGHFIRIFVAKDEGGHVIDDTFVVVQDYQGINYDYQDNVYLVQGIAVVPELLIG